MSIGQKFLKRVLSESSDSSQSTLVISYDTQHQLMKEKLLTPKYATDILDLFVLIGIPGRFLNSDDFIAKIKDQADMLRKSSSVRASFLEFLSAIKVAKSPSKNLEEAKKRGGILQVLLEEVLIRFGLPAELVSVESTSTTVVSYINKFVSLLEKSEEMTAALRKLALKLNIKVGAIQESKETELNESITDINVGPDEFSQTVLELLLLLGTPVEALAMKRSQFLMNLHKLRGEITEKQKVIIRMEALINTIHALKKEEPVQIQQNQSMQPRVQ